MLVTMNPTLWNGSPRCHSTLATTHSWSVPASRLIPEVVIANDVFSGRPPCRALQQIDAGNYGLSLFWGTSPPPFATIMQMVSSEHQRCSSHEV